MKRGSTIFLQVVIILIGIGALALMLWEPHLEGRNVDATLFEIYFKDAFLAYAYVASLPFFIALYQAFMLLGYIGQNKVFSPNSVKALRSIKYCAISIVGFVLGAEVYLFLVQRGTEDIAGGVAIGVVIMFTSSVIAVFAAVLQKLIQNGLDLKSENDLTV